jgi:hypothetical protein
VGPQLQPGAEITITFTNPYGETQLGDSAYAFIGQNPIYENFPFNGFKAYQYIAYTFAENELDVIGTWSVQANIGSFISQTVTFQVTALGRKPKKYR